MSALSDLVHSGKVRAIGSSTFPAEQIVEAQWVAEKRGYVRFRSEQPPYSIFVRGIEGSVLPACEKYGMGVIPWSPLAGGWLTGRIRKDTGVDMTRERARRLPERFDQALPGNQAKLDAVEELIKIAAGAGCSLTHMALAFVVAHPAVTAAIIGPRTMDQLTDILAGADTTLEDDILDRIDQIVPPGVNLNPSDAGFQPRRRWPTPTPAADRSPAGPPRRVPSTTRRSARTGPAVSVHHVRGETWSWACISPISPGPGARAALGPALARHAQNAEAAGITRISVMDHFWQIRGVGPGRARDAGGVHDAGLPGRATPTGSKLLTLVTGVVYRHPGLLAKVVTTLDVLSGGRARLGVGAAWNEEESRGLGSASRRSPSGSSGWRRRCRSACRCGAATRARTTGSTTSWGGR